MKRTGRRLYLSGGVRYKDADAIATTGAHGDTLMFQNIMLDERSGYAYKVTFAACYPSILYAPPINANPFAIQSFTGRELRRMSNTQLLNAAGYLSPENISIIAESNRNIGIVGYREPDLKNDNNWHDYQNSYLIKGDAMVTNSISLCVNIINAGGQTAATTGYYIELDEYEISDDEEILLLLNQRAQDAAGED